MPEPRLHEALELMKQGKKHQAALLVREILRQDRENFAAWWLMANLLDDEEKVVKCLYQLLKLNPEHRGARQKLIALRPDLAEQFGFAQDVPPAKEKHIPTHEHKHSETVSAQAQRSFYSSILGAKVSGVALVLFLVIILLGISTFAAIYFKVFTANPPLLDAAGNTPQTVVEEYIQARWLEDADALYRLSCPDYHSEIKAMVAAFSGYDYSNWTVDTSQTTFDLFYYSGNQAYVTYSGVISMMGEGQTFSMNWSDDAQSQGFEGYGEHLHSTNGVWQICISQPVPGIQEDNS